jgi:hypothetical protein
MYSISNTSVQILKKYGILGLYLKFFGEFILVGIGWIWILLYMKLK